MLAVGAAACVAAPAALAQPGTSFTYQGVLTESGTVVNSSVLVDFKLFDADVGGTQVGPTISSTVTPSNGVFSESLDFGVDAYATNQALWLEITVNGDLLGRQKLEAAPFALNTRGIDVQANPGFGQVTLPESILHVDYPDLTGSPNGSAFIATTPGGVPGFFLRRGDGAGNSEHQYYWTIPANNSLHITSNNSSHNTTRMAITSDGNVGIGTTSPATKLDVNGIASMNSLMVDGEAFVGNDQLEGQGLHLVNSSGQWEIGSDTQGGGNNQNQFYIYDTNTGQYALTILRQSGLVGIGTTTPATKLDVNGAVTIRGGADIVEGFETATTDAVEPGSLMVIDPENPGKLMLSTHAYDAKVAGVVSGANGVNPGIKLGQDGMMDGDLPVAMTGRVYVKCSAENGPVMPGDRLTTSSIPGHAMKATDSERSDGAVIGKAMTSLDSETGMVLVLVNLQ